MVARLERKSIRARRFVSNPPFPGSCSRRKLVYRALSNMEESLFRVDDFRCVLGALSSRDVCTRREEKKEDRVRGRGFQSIREIESKSYGSERFSLELETKHSNKSRRNESTEGILINENKTKEKGISRFVLRRAPWAIDISNARARAQKESTVSFEYRGKKKLIRHQPTILAIYTEFFSRSTIW